MTELFKNTEVKLIPGLVPVFFVMRGKEAVEYSEWKTLYMSEVPSVKDTIQCDGVTYTVCHLQSPHPDYIVRVVGGCEVGIPLLAVQAPGGRRVAMIGYE